MQISTKKERRQTIFFLLCILTLSFAVQLCKFQIFPDKYFYDAGAVQNLMRQPQNFALSDSYVNTALLFQGLGRFLPMGSQVLGGLVIWALGIPVLLFAVLKNLRTTWEQYALAGVYSVLLPVFVWNTHKEAVQFAFFAVLAWVAASCKKKSNKADGLLVCLLLLWSLLFRSYYIVIGAGTLVFILFSRIPWGTFKPTQKRRIVLILAAAFMAGFALAALLRPELLIKLFDGRMAVNRTRGNDPDANTIILDWVKNPNNTVLLYAVNYLLAAVRLMFPVELLFKGAQYLPFVALQLVWTGMLLCAVAKLLRGRWKGEAEKRLLFIAMAWYLVSFLFEPDFGSFVRHQAAAFPILYPVLSGAIRKDGSIFGL